MCKDRAIDYFNAQHYNPLLLPRENFDPLAVLGRGPDGVLTEIGGISDLVSAKDVAPAIRRDEAVPDASNRRSDKLDAKTSVDALGRILRALGAGGIGLKAEGNADNAFQIVTLDVRRDSLLYLPLSRWLLHSTLLEDSAQLLAPYPDLFIVTETLKSNTLGIVGYSGAGAKAELEADALKDIISVSGSLEVSHGAGRMLCYKGERELRFAFRALRLNLTDHGLAVDSEVASGPVKAVAGAQTPADGALPLAAFPVIEERALLDVQARG